MMERTAEQIADRRDESGGIDERLRFRVLGPVRVLDHGGGEIDVGGSKPRLVLVQLLLNPNRVVSSDALIDALWGDDPPPSARRSLQAHVAKLRAALGGDAGPIRSHPPGYVLVVDEDQVDLWRSEDLVRQARASLLSNPRQAHHLARQARSLWTSEPLADLAAHDPLVPQRRRLAGLWFDLIELELDAELAVGDTSAVVERLESLVLEWPEHEPFWARLMTAQYRLGRQGEALRSFQRARTALRDALGIDPSPELKRLEGAILGQATELEDVPTPRCPYQGLASYQLDDADRFYGRDDLVAELVEAVRTESFVVVVGSSGVGKSSALRAGLVKAVETRKLSGVRQAAVITPGTSPLRSIYQVPRSADVVIVDQFEELFTLTSDEAAQREFVRVLLARVNDGAGHVVISLRADFYGHCTRIPELAPLLARRQVVVGPLSEDELRVVITKPAEQAGLVVDHELVDLVVTEAANSVGALPLVSHAMVETWLRRTDDRLTVAAYREAGSIGAAIARTAERVYGGCQPAQRLQVEQLFLRLVEPGEAAEHARRNVPYGQLDGSSIDREVVDLLVDARLLTAGADGVDIAHEALIDAWPRLRSWIDDDRDGIRIHRHLTSAAAAWAELGRDEGELYRGARLAAALAWVADATPDLSDLERDFIEAAVETSETQLHRQLRANRRLRILVAVSVVGAIVAAAGTVFALSNAKNADHRRAEAEAAQLVATTRAEPGLSDSDVLLLAMTAHRRASTTATQGLLLDAIAHDSGLVAQGEIEAIPVGSAPISSTGGVLPAIDDDVFGIVLDARTMDVRTGGLRPYPLAVVDTGSRLLGVTRTTLETVDLETGETVGPSPGVTSTRPSHVALSPDGAILAVADTATQRGTVEGVSLYDVTTGQAGLTMDAAGGASVRNVTFSPDSQHVLAVVDDRRVMAWDTATGQRVFESPPDTAERAGVTRLAMSPSSTLIAFGRQDGRVEMWTLGDEWRSLPLDGPSSHRDAISWVDFDAQSRRMVSTSGDGLAIVWDTTTGEVAAGPLEFDSGGGGTTFFRPGSGTSLVTVADGRTWDWDLQRNRRLLTTVDGVNLGATVSAAPDERVLVGGPAGVTVHDPNSGARREVRIGPGDTSIRGIAASADGTRFAVVYDDGRLELRDATSGDIVIAMDGRVGVGGEIMIAIDRHGTRVAFQTVDERIQVVDDDGTTGDQIGLMVNHRNLQALDLSDDGSELVVSTSAGEAIWYDVDGFDAALIAERGVGYDAQFVSDDRVALIGRDGAQIIDPRTSQTSERFTLGTDGTRLAVDAAGALLATADKTGAIQLWDAETAQPIGAALRSRNGSSARPMHFSADGRHLLVSGPDDTTWISVRTADWHRIACSLITDDLSSAERTRLLGSIVPPELCT
jgi:DNA-binding SARP family transcriptional activator/WD40 repeat protein